MKRTIKNWVILVLSLSFITVSCKKDMMPDKNTIPNTGNALSGSDDNSLVKDLLPNDVVIEWSNIAYETAGGAMEGHPLLQSRIKAMTYIAMHDALNAIVPVYQSYAYHPAHKINLANPFAAVASAACTVLKASYPDSAAMLDAKLQASLSGIAIGPGKTAGVELGKAAGDAIVAMRAGDGAFQYPISYWSPSEVPGVYNAPDDSAYGVFWKDMQPFSLQSPEQFLSSPPPALNSFIYTRDYNEIKHFGKINSAVRTADQTAYAYFWFEFQDITWNRIATMQATKTNMNLYTTARMFALLNMALADGYTASWNAKYHYNSWRPITAIHAAATDGNDLTKPNPNWEPLMPTPPVPDYPSGHAALANTCATILSHFFGNETSFTDATTTAVPAGTERSFKSFMQAADECASSRVMVGIHFRFACEAGQAMGNKVGKWTLEHQLLPLH